MLSSDDSLGSSQTYGEGGWWRRRRPARPAGRRAAPSPPAPAPAPAATPHNRSHTLRFPQPRTEAERRLTSFKDTISARRVTVPLSRHSVPPPGPPAPQPRRVSFGRRASRAWRPPRPPRRAPAMARDLTEEERYSLAALYTLALHVTQVREGGRE